MGTEHCWAGEARVLVCICQCVVVKFLWPVGGALMQCFKARWIPLEVRAGRQRDRERRRGKGEKGRERRLQQMPPKKTPQAHTTSEFQ